MLCAAASAVSACPQRRMHSLKLGGAAPIRTSLLSRCDEDSGFGKLGRDRMKISGDWIRAAPHSTLEDQV